MLDLDRLKELLAKATPGSLKNGDNADIVVTVFNSAPSLISALEAEREEVAKLMEVVETARWARTRLHDFAVAEQAGRVQGGGRELERKVWGAFSDFDAALARAYKETGDA